MQLDDGKLPVPEFAAAQDAVYELLKTECARFQKSQLHKEMIAHMPENSNGISKQKKKSFFKSLTTNSKQM